jgi:cellulose synthase/poly-beta-1,6-N-acetylglucosamine synthase-like glycosyltransferase
MSCGACAIIPDYPAEKLDVIVAVEADDRETRATIAARNNRMPITVIPVPTQGPRTKPKALNVALPFARGAFTVIYDAEDRPEPDQLRRALQAFRAGGDDLACVQARLCIDNTADSWLARLFTAEYAGQFDVFLPGLAALRLPLPLGGSSNHFHTASLREVGGWDPYNVTEDADLGMRFARFGYRSSVLNSTTYEEAPARFGPWLRQRTRWFKGWMQTWAVHMRQPARLLRDLGLPGFLTFQLIVGGNALAALVHPLFLAALIYSVASGAPMWRGESATVTIRAAVYGMTVVIGYLTSAFLGWLGLLRRGLLDTAWVLVLTPVHWLLLSLAAWRALYQLAFAPYAWEKTEHGLAKSSRRAANLTRSLLALERHLSALKEAGELPTLVPDATSHGSGRHRLPQAPRPRLETTTAMPYMRTMCRLSSKRRIILPTRNACSRSKSGRQLSTGSRPIHAAGW